jgi:hypothetical protein
MKRPPRRSPRSPGAHRSRTGKFDRKEGNTVEPGRNVLVIAPEIRDNWPAALKDKLAVRRATALRGLCPSCAAIVEIERQPHPGTISRALVRHDNECPAVADV